MVFSDCTWPVKKSVFAELGYALPLGIKGIRITDKLSKAQLISFCEGLCDGRGVLSEVWVYCDQYKGPDVRMGKYVLLTNSAKYNKLLPG